MGNAKTRVIQIVKQLPDSSTTDDILRALLESAGWPKYPKLGVKCTRKDTPLIEKICASYTKARLWEIARVLKVNIADVRNWYKAAIVARILDSGGIVRINGMVACLVKSYRLDLRGVGLEYMAAEWTWIAPSLRS